MRTIPAILFLLGTAAMAPAHADDAAKCRQGVALAQMAAAGSSATLDRGAVAAGSGYAARLVHAARAFELSGRDPSHARSLLDQLPADPADNRAWLELDGLMCDGRVSQPLALLAGRLADDMADAAIRAPERMGRYLRFAFEAVQDPHSGYIVAMQRVCKRRPIEFGAAVQDLPGRDRAWFSAHILDVRRCRALVLPESDD